MGVWKKSPRADPAEIARVQAVVTPMVAELQRTAADASRRSGRSTGWGDIPTQIKTRLQQQGVQLPDGYDVNMEGQVVYTNKTPFLQQAAWAATPFVAGQAASSLAGAFAGPAAAAATTAAAPTTTAAATGAGFLGMGGRGWLDAAIFGGQLFGDIWGTKQQVGASDRAAEAQLQANREALAFLEKQWTTAREDFAPYLKLGHTSAGRLDDYLTTTPRPTMPANLRQQMEGGYDPQTYTPRPGWTPPPPPPTPTGATAGGGAAQRPATLGQSFGRPSDAIDLSQRPEGVSTTQPVPMAGGNRPRPGPPPGTWAPNAPATTGPGQRIDDGGGTLADFGRAPVSTPQPAGTQMVRVQAPDGEIRELPIQQAARAMQMGARRVA